MSIPIDITGIWWVSLLVPVSSVPPAPRALIISTLVRRREKRKRIIFTSIHTHRCIYIYIDIYVYILYKHIIYMYTHLSFTAHINWNWCAQCLLIFCIIHVHSQGQTGHASGRWLGLPAPAAGNLGCDGCVARCGAGTGGTGKTATRPRVIND